MGGVCYEEVFLVLYKLNKFVSILLWWLTKYISSLFIMNNYVIWLRSRICRDVLVQNFLSSAGPVFCFYQTGLCRYSGSIYMFLNLWLIIWIFLFHIEYQISIILYKFIYFNTNILNLFLIYHNGVKPAKKIWLAGAGPVKKS